MNKAAEVWSRLTNTNNSKSVFALLISAILLTCGHLFWHQHPNTDLLFSYLDSSALLMGVYAIGYGVHASYTTEFEGGLISARLVLCLIGISTCLSYLWCGIEMQNLPQISSDDKFFCLVQGLGVYVGFAITYGLYVCSVKRDLVPASSLAREGKRTGPARITIKLMKAALCATLLYSVALACMAVDQQLILLDVAGLTVTFVICTFVEWQFERHVHVDLDRGVTTEST